MINKYTPFCLIVVFALSGCTTLGSVERKYNKISYADGIDKSEAKVIAQREYLKNSSNDSYKSRSAKVYDSEEVLLLSSEEADFVTHDKIYEEYKKKLKYDDSWYVTFKPRFLSFFSNYYLVVLDKNKGDIQYSHDSNTFSALGQIMFAYIKPKLVSSMLIGRYYRDNNELPKSITELRQYLSDKSEGKFEESETLKDYEIEKLSEKRVKVRYALESEMQALYEVLSKSTTNVNRTGEYELEVSTDGDKTILQAYGDMGMKFILTDSTMTTVGPKEISSEDAKNLEKILDSLFE